MRKSLIIVLVAALAVPSLQARRPRDRAGKVSDGVYTDKKYGFQINMTEGWKYKIKDNEDKLRLVLLQLNYEIPTHYAEAPDYTKIPTVAVYVDTTSMSVPAFIDSLVSETFSSKQKKDIYGEFEILNRGASGSGMTREELVPRLRKYVEIGGETGLLWTGKSKYRNEIAASASAMGAQRVYGGLAGSIVGVKRDNTIILIHTICEENYFEAVLNESMAIINTLQWVE
ncbi:MAG: hypothetical protein JSW34_11640 [Candidatus Zixiibacteriota bacterium]|nr:MAG: hypothetical protein JSW34_11640 [candidate division Zixibacteria bacterium]